MSKKMHSIGESVQARRATLRLSQRDLARAAGTTAAAVSHIERGIRNPSAGLLARIAVSLGCSADDLLQGNMRTTGSDRHIAHVVAVMKDSPVSLRKEVARFCDFLRQQSRGRT